MSERNEPQDSRHASLAQAASYVVTGDRNRGATLAGAVIGRVLERDGGKVTGRVVIAAFVVLAVAGLAFVAYRLLVLDLLLTLMREGD